MQGRHVVFLIHVALGLAVGWGFRWLLRRRRGPAPRRWEWGYCLTLGPALMAGVAALVLFDRPAWVPPPPTPTWVESVMGSLIAAMWAFAGWYAWRVTRWRWHAAAMGPPVLTADPLATFSRKGFSLDALAGCPPRLRPAAAVPPRWGWNLGMLAGMTGVSLVSLSAVGGPGSAWVPRPLGMVFEDGFAVLLAAEAAAGAVMAVALTVGDAWGVPVRRWFLTAEGVLALTLTVKWEDAGAVTLGPAPRLDGVRLLEVTAPAPNGLLLGRVGPRTLRLLVDPSAGPALDTLLTAVPDGRLARVPAPSETG